MRAPRRLVAAGAGAVGALAVGGACAAGVPPLPSASVSDQPPPASAHVAGRALPAASADLPGGTPAAAYADPARAAHAQLAHHLAARSEQHEIAAVDAPPQQSATSALEWRARRLDGAPLARRMQVWVDGRRTGRVVRTLPIAFEVRAWRDAWLATRDARVGEALESAAVERRRVDIAAAGVEPLGELPHAARLRRPVRTGDVLTAAHVEPMPAVGRGTSVVVHARVGAIAVQARAEALQDGRTGAPVWVRLARATAPVRARVVADGIVEIGDE